jgi:hypothetical protein
MNWRFEVPTLEVPERYIDAGESGYDEAFLPLIAKAIVKVLPVMLGSERFFADQLSRHRLHDSRVGAGRSKTLPPTRGAVLSCDFDKARGSGVGCVEAPSEWLRELRLEDMSTNIGNAHGIFLSRW